MKKVLVVEDDPFIMDITSVRLTDHGYKVQVANTGEIALSIIGSEAPDVILLDLDLPGISGIEVMTELKKNDATKNIPIIIFSNNDSDAVKAETAKHGASDFFVKASTDFKELFSKIDALTV